MRHLTIPEAKDVICGELAVPGDWVVANIHEYVLASEGTEGRLLRRRCLGNASDEGQIPALAINRPPGTEPQGKTGNHHNYAGRPVTACA